MIGSRELDLSHDAFDALPAAGLEGLRQAHVDEYVAGGTSSRKHVRNFLLWLRKQSDLPRARVHAQHREAQSLLMISENERLHMVRNCIEFEQAALSTRVAGLIHLLWAQPLNKIVMLSRDDIAVTVDGMTIRLGPLPSPVPEPLIPMFWQLRQHPDNASTSNTDTRWLFPGRLAGRHITAQALSERLGTLGIDPQRARNATLRRLVTELDARTLINLLGYRQVILARHAALAATPMAGYVSIRAAD